MFVYPLNDLIPSPYALSLFTAPPPALSQVVLHPFHLLPFTHLPRPNLSPILPLLPSFSLPSSFPPSSSFLSHFLPLPHPLLLNFPFFIFHCRLFVLLSWERASVRSLTLAFHCMLVDLPRTTTVLTSILPMHLFAILFTCLSLGKLGQRVGFLCSLMNDGKKASFRLCSPLVHVMGTARNIS